MLVGVKNLDLVLQVATYVRENVANGVFKAGERLYEAQLARTLGMSRTPVREAARLLESEGLLICQPNKGFAVRKMSVREFIDVSNFRITIEREAMRIICRSPRRTKVITALEACFEEILRQNESAGPAEQIKADSAFHRTIVAAAGNGSMLKAYDHLTRDLQVAFRLMHEFTSDWTSICESHLPVINALKEGDPDACADAIETHLKLAWDETLDELAATMNAPLNFGTTQRNGLT
jgi:DNA-binding GntR family transcriptional regulator